MFDFDNTPITEYTKLKANYKCEAEPLLTYNGDWARITLTDGSVLEVVDESQLNSLLTSTSTTTVAGQAVAVANIKSIEFGTKVTAIPTAAVNLDSWSNLENINGFHEGLTTFLVSFTESTSSARFSPLIKSTIVLPSTLTSASGDIFYCSQRFAGTVIVNAPASIFPTSSHIFATQSPTAPIYTEGVKIMGAYAQDFITKFPNLNGTTFYRNFYNGNTIENFLEALEDGSAQETMPPGTVIDTIYNDSTPIQLRVVGYGSGKQEDGLSIGGVVLQGLPQSAFPPIAYGGNVKYPVSTLRTTLLSTVKSGLPTGIQDKMKPVEVPALHTSTSAPDSTSIVYDPIFAFSVLEMMGTNTLSKSVISEPLQLFYNYANGTKTDANLAGRALTYAYILRDGATSSYMYDINTNGKIEQGASRTTTYYPTFGIFLEAKVRVTVSFNANGGTPEPPDQRVFIGSYATEPDPAPSKEGSEFVGWFLPGQTYDFVGEIPVMFRMNGGTPQEPTQYVKAGEYATEPTSAPEREGFEFIGWYKAGTVPDDWDGINVI